MNINKLTEKLNEFKEDIDKYQEQLDIINDNTRFYSRFEFGMSAGMSSWGQSEMPSDYFPLPSELKANIAQMYKSWVEKEIKRLETERTNLIKEVNK